MPTGNAILRSGELSSSHRSQAERLPKDFRVEREEVCIRKQRTAVILEPMASDWRWLDEIAGEFSEDFLSEGRNQPPLPKPSQVDRVFD